MKITRDVVMDLLPVYLAGEASADSGALVEEFALEHAEFGNVIAAQRKELALESRALKEPVAALSSDHEVKTLVRTRRLAARLRWLMAVAIWLTVFPLSFVGDGGHITFFLLRDAPLLAVPCWLGAGVSWGVFVSTRRKLRASGL
jgi:hypothetical protein